MVKKKFHGGYGLLFGVLCCLFVGFSSTSCYARTTLTYDEGEYIINYIFSNIYDNSSYTQLNSYNINSVYTKSYFAIDNVKINSFLDYFNNYNTVDIDVNSTLFWIRFYSSTSATIYFSIIKITKINSCRSRRIKSNPK